MMTLKNILLSCGLTVAAISPANAGAINPVIGYADAIATGGTETMAFAGLNWTFGASPTPELVLGAVHSQTTSDGIVQGAKAAVYLDVGAGFALDKAKLTGLYGDQSVQGELGFGYNFQSGTGFGVVGANAGNFPVG